MNAIIKTMIAIKTILTKINYYTPPSDSKYPSCLEFPCPRDYVVSWSIASKIGYCIVP